MKLYAYRNCPFSRRVRIALAEHGVDYEYLEQDPAAPYPPEIRDKIPLENGGPVLFVRDDFVLWDSTAIVHWIDSSHPRSLYPSQREPQAIARAWQGWISTKLYPALDKVRDGDAAEKKRAEDTIVRALHKMNRMVEGEWLVAGEFTIADIALAPVVVALSSTTIASLPENIRGYIGRLKARPSVREVCELDLPDEQRPSFAA